MNLGADMVGDKPNDALAIGRGETLARIAQAHLPAGRSRAGRRD